LASRDGRLTVALRAEDKRRRTMRDAIFVGSAFVAKYPEGGGNFWVPLQWLLGLRAAGHDAFWLEVVWGDGAADRARAFVDGFLRRAAGLGVGDRVVVLLLPDGGRDDPPGRVECLGALDAAAVRARAAGGLLVNLANSVTAPHRAGFARTVLLDVDPGPFQLWARDSDLGVGGHDVHVTIGQHLGAPDSPVPLGGVPWARTWPTVHLPAWPVRPAAGGRWTTVTQWWNNQYAFLDGATYDCNKRTGFLRLVDLPGRSGLPLELAANVHPGETEDRALLARHGWRLVDPAVVAGTPETFRAYVQASRGELSAAKPAYVQARAGWVSDRTICYLASGRPCVVEATGAEAHLPPSAGLRFFTDAAEAAEALAAVEADYATAARAARALAEEVFATSVVVPALLRAAGVA
jgi:hypothetical protein